MSDILSVLLSGQKSKTINKHIVVVEMTNKHALELEMKKEINKRKTECDRSGNLVNDKFNLQEPGPD